MPLPTAQNGWLVTGENNRVRATLKNVQMSYQDSMVRSGFRGAVRAMFSGEKKIVWFAALTGVDSSENFQQLFLTLGFKLLVRASNAVSVTDAIILAEKCHVTKWNPFNGTIEGELTPNEDGTLYVHLNVMPSLELPAMTAIPIAPPPKPEIELSNTNMASGAVIGGVIGHNSIACPGWGGAFASNATIWPPPTVQPLVEQEKHLEMIIYGLVQKNVLTPKEALEALKKHDWNFELKDKPTVVEKKKEPQLKLDPTRDVSFDED